MQITPLQFLQIIHFTQSFFFVNNFLDKFLLLNILIIKLSSHSSAGRAPPW